MSDLNCVSISFPEVANQFSHLSGKILTIVDGTFSDPAQRKAVKDLVRISFQTQVERLERLCREKLQGAQDLSFIVLMESGTRDSEEVQPCSLPEPCDLHPRTVPSEAESTNGFTANAGALKIKVLGATGKHITTQPVTDPPREMLALKLMSTDSFMEIEAWMDLTVARMLGKKILERVEKN
jgi:hypothetical protein